MLGVYLIDAKTDKVFLRKWDGTFSELTLLSALKLNDFDVGLAGDTDVLMGITAKAKSKTDSTLHIYNIDKTGVAKKKSSFIVPVSSSLKILAQGSKVLLACGAEGICLADLSVESSEGQS
ncbi:MAG: hypothetical protein ACD_73C00757G0001, partial [uncultured bacterium]